MKCIIIILLAVFFSFELSAQPELKLTYQKENFLDNNDSINSTQLSVGIGLLHDFRSRNYVPLAEFNSNLHIYKPIFLNLGFDIYPSPEVERAGRIGIFVCPNLAFHEERNKISIFLGGGPYLINPFPMAGYAGWLVFSRIQHNITRRFSAGLEVKFSIVNKEGDDERFISMNAYMSVRL